MKSLEVEEEEEGVVASGRKMKPVSRPTLVTLKSSTLEQWRSVEKLKNPLTEVQPSSVKVFESRGMQVCEEAVKLLKNSKRKPIKVTIHSNVSCYLTFFPFSGHSSYLWRRSQGG